MFCGILPYCNNSLEKKKKKRKTNPNEFLAPSGYFCLCWGLILTNTAGLPQHGLTFLFSSAGKADTDLVETGVYRVTLGNCFPWLCILWSPTLKTFHSPVASFLIANCTTVYLCILHIHRKASAKTSTPKKSSWVNWGRLQDLWEMRLIKYLTLVQCKPFIQTSEHRFPLLTEIKDPRDREGEGGNAFERFHLLFPSQHRQAR